jgi:hypothetical protein
MAKRAAKKAKRSAKVGVKDLRPAKASKVKGGGYDMQKNVKL